MDWPLLVLDFLHPELPSPCTALLLPKGKGIRNPSLIDKLGERVLVEGHPPLQHPV